jgi:hypothetical protein
MSTPDSNAALATLIYRLLEQVEGLQESVSTLTASTSGHDHPELAAELEALGRTLSKLTEEEEERVTSRSAPRWDRLEEQEYQALLSKVGGWVDGHLRMHYPGYLRDAVQDCWPRHPEALWELGNLWAEWNRTYDRKKPSLDDALTWHERWMPGARARLAEVMKACRAGSCSRRTIHGAQSGGAL